MARVGEAVEILPGEQISGVEPASCGRLEGGLRLIDPGRCRRGEPTRPLVSYVTVVRNASATLARTLASVRAQQWDAVEHIVVDGLSDDGTRDIIRAHEAQIDYYVSEPDEGLYFALNKALSMVRGDLVCVLNADDWLTPDAAAIAANALMRRRNAADPRPPLLILTSAWLHDGRRRKLWLPGPLDAGSWLRCPKICHNGAYATPEAISLAGPYDTRLKIIADTRWLCGAFDAGVRIVHCAAPTVHYVSGGLSSDYRRHVEESAQLIAHRFPALDSSEVWTLIHCFYPWTDNLKPFASSRPGDLGLALEALLARHAGDEALQRSARSAGLAEQRGHAGRVRTRRKFTAQLQRGLLRVYYGARDLMGSR
jgi:hypothetical protein